MQLNEMRQRLALEASQLESVQPWSSKACRLGAGKNGVGKENREITSSIEKDTKCNKFGHNVELQTEEERECQQPHKKDSKCVESISTNMIFLSLKGSRC